MGNYQQPKDNRGGFTNIPPFVVTAMVDNGDEWSSATGLIPEPLVDNDTAHAEP